MVVQQLFDDATHPTSAFFENTPITPAMTVYFDVDGHITQAAFWGPSNIGGTYVMQVWQATTDDDPAGTGTGTSLDTTTDFDVPVADGIWNWATFDPPLPVTAGVPYRVGYVTDEGRYAALGAYFASAPATSGDIHAPQHGTNPIGFGLLSNGVFFVGSGGYPNQSFNATWYGTNVRFEPAGGADVDGDATLAATGGLTATGDVVSAATATMAATGGLAATGTVVHAASATTAGSGGLSAASTVARAGAATTAGVGGLAATSAATRPGSATLGAVGDLFGSAEIAGDSSATGAATGGLAAVGTVGRAGSATFGATGGLAATGTVVSGSTAVAGGVGALTAVATVTRNATATFTGIGGLNEAAPASALPIPNTGTATVRDLADGTAGVRDLADGTAVVL